VFKTWELKNNGDSAWPANCKLVLIIGIAVIQIIIVIVVLYALVVLYYGRIAAVIVISMVLFCCYCYYSVFFIMYFNEYCCIIISANGGDLIKCYLIRLSKGSKPNNMKSSNYKISART
jgi:uncharacterized Tic20 family protein